MNPRQHLISIDLIRLLSAFAIIIIHVAGFVVATYPSPHRFEWTLGLFLASYFRWGTPVFIMVSGYLLLGKDKYSPKDFYRRRLNRLLIPLIFWNFFYYIIYTHLNGVSRTPIDFLNRFMGGGTFYHLYFLCLILGLYFITPILNKYLLLSPKLGKITLSLLLFSFGYVALYTWFGFPQLNNVFTWFILYIGYYLAGYWLPQTNFRPKLVHLVFALVLPVFGFIANFYLVRFFGPNDQGVFFTHRLSYFIAIPSLILFQYFVSLKVNLNLPVSKIQHLASLSFGVYLVHPAIIQVFVSLSPFSLLLKNNHIFWVILVIPTTLILSFTLVKILSSSKILGKLV